METQPPRSADSTPEDQRHLDRLKQVIEQASADGKLTQAEINRIKAVVWADGEVSPEEMTIVTQMVKEKIARGELAIEW